MNQIGFGTFVANTIGSSFYNLLSLIFIILISTSNYFKTSNTLPNIGINNSKNSKTINDTINKISSPRNQILIYTFLYTFFITLVNQHFFIESGKISEDCREASSDNLFTISKPYIIYIGLLILFINNKYARVIIIILCLSFIFIFIVIKKVKNINYYIYLPYILFMSILSLGINHNKDSTQNAINNISNKWVKYLLNNQALFYSVILIFLIIWSLYNVVTLSDNQMQTSDPTRPYIAIIGTSVFYTIAFYFVIMKNMKYQSINTTWYSSDSLSSLFNFKSLTNISLLTILFISFFTYTYTINVGGVNYDCN